MVEKDYFTSSERANNEECICLVSSLVLLQEVFSLLPCHFSRPISLVFWILAVGSNFELNLNAEKFNFFAFETLFETKVELKVELREDLILVVAADRSSCSPGSSQRRGSNSSRGPGSC